MLTGKEGRGINDALKWENFTLQIDDNEEKNQIKGSRIVGVAERGKNGPNFAYARKSRTL